MQIIRGKYGPATFDPSKISTALTRERGGSTVRTSWSVHRARTTGTAKEGQNMGSCDSQVDRSRTANNKKTLVMLSTIHSMSGEVYEQYSTHLNDQGL